MRPVYGERKAKGLEVTEEKIIKLTPREAEVLECLVRGRRYKEIADELGISIETVRHHIKSIYMKLHVNSRTEAVVKSLRNGRP